MPVLFRHIKYEFNSQEELDFQMNKSLAPGVHTFIGGRKITIVDTATHFCPPPLYLEALPVLKAITKEQLHAKENPNQEETNLKFIPSQIIRKDKISPKESNLKVTPKESYPFQNQGSIRLPDTLHNLQTKEWTDTEEE